MDLSPVDLYSTTPLPAAQPGMRVVSHAGTRHLQCPTDPLNAPRSQEDWTAWATSLESRWAPGEGPGTLTEAAGQLEAGTVATLLKGQRHLPPSLARDLSATLLAPALDAVLRAPVTNFPDVPDAGASPVHPLFHPLLHQMVIVGLLLAHGARPTVKTLCAAAEGPNPALLHRLLDLEPANGWAFDAVPPNESPLWAVASTNHWSTAPETIDQLLAAAVPIDQVDPNQGSVLAMAVKNQTWLVVRRLLERGANPNLGDLGNTTPLHVAARNDDVRSLDLLMRAGSSPSPCLGHSNVDLLRVAGVNPNAPLTNGNTPLNEAARMGSANALEFFLGRGFDPLADADATYPDGRSLHLARKASVSLGGTPRGERVRACVAILEGHLLRREVDRATDPGTDEAVRPRARL